MSRPGEKTSPLLCVAAAWLVVTIPLAWGVYQTAKKSLPLFRMSAAAGDRTAGGSQVIEEVLERRGVRIQGHAVRAVVIVDLAVLEVLVEGRGADRGHHVLVVRARTRPRSRHPTGWAR